MTAHVDFVPRGRYRGTAPNEAALLRVLSLLGGETEPGDFEYSAVMSAIYDDVQEFRERHVAMFQAYEDGLNSIAAQCARQAAEEAYAVADAHAKLATVFEAMTDRPVNPPLRYGGSEDGQ